MFRKFGFCSYQNSFPFLLVIAFSFTSPVYNVKENEKAVVEIQLASGEISEPVTIE